jgi:thymidylate synthase (FAD)
MKVSLLDHTVNPVQKIGRFAGVCYDAKTDTESNIKRAKHCKDKGHLATLRFAYATFNVSGISRVCSHQLVRIAHAGILQESQRYVEQSNIEFICPDSVSNLPPHLFNDWLALLSKAQQVYYDCISNGMKKEDARYILPQSCTTQINLCLNFQAWQDVLKNRTKKTSQWEIRAVATDIQKQLNSIAPEIFDYPECQENPA